MADGGAPSAEPRATAMLAAAVVLGFVLRTLGIAENPPGFHFDESNYAVNGALIAEAGVDQYGARWPLFFRALDEYKEPLLVYAVAASGELLGLSPASTRLPTAVWGTLGLLAAYALCREVTGSREAGVWAALFLAVTPWHIHFSRWCAPPIILSVTHSAAVWLLIRLVRRRDVLSGVLAGLALASGLYAYSAGKLLVPVTLGAFLLFARHRRLLGSRGLLAFLAAFAAAAAPFAVFYLAAGEAMNLRFQRLRLPWREVPAAYLSSLHPDFLFGRGDSNLRHATRAGMLAWYTAPLMLWGAFRVRRSLAGLALLGLLAFSPLLGAFSRQYPQAGRTITMVPYVAVLAAVAAIDLLARLAPAARARARIALLALIAVSLVGFWNPYWTRYTVRSRDTWRHGLMPALSFAAETARAGESVYAPTAHYSDWMFVTRTSAEEVKARRSVLNRYSDSYDPLDLRNKYAFLQPRGYIGRPARRGPGSEPLPQGLWVLPRDRCAPYYEGLLYQNAGYCVVRVS